MKPHDLKARLLPYRRATCNFDKASVRHAMTELFDANVVFNCCHPFGQMTGADQLFRRCLEPLCNAMPDLERRDMIVIAGTTDEGEHWVGTMGNYMGTFVTPFLGIPPTGHVAHMRYHEFYKIENNHVCEVQAIWDIPELMMQANAWPMAPQLGSFLCTPAPMSGDGLAISGDGTKSLQHVIDMLTDLCRHPVNPDPSIMQLEKYWHPQFNWYGPAGIGTCRGVAGFRHWHQIPFLRAMPDRKLDAMGALKSHWVAQDQFVCETGWPNMRLTLSHDGWMGIAPSNKEVLLRSLDFWRIEDNLIRENWVLVDLLDLYSQVGVDVFARLAEFNKARNLGAITLSDGLDALT